MKLNRRLARFNIRINELEKTISFYGNKPVLSKEDILFVERVLIQAQIEFEHFIRNLILDSATGRYQNLKGRVYSSLSNHIYTREKASYILLSTYKKRNKEPDWYLPKEAVQAAQNLQLSNFQNISAQLGVTPWPLDELRHVRNFIAHRSKKSAIELKNAGLTISNGRVDPVKCAYAYSSSGTQNYLIWINFIKYIASQLVL